MTCTHAIKADYVKEFYTTSIKFKNGARLPEGNRASMRCRHYRSTAWSTKTLLKRKGNLECIVIDPNAASVCPIPSGQIAE